MGGVVVLVKTVIEKTPLVCGGGEGERGLRTQEGKETESEPTDGERAIGTDNPVKSGDTACRSRGR